MTEREKIISKINSLLKMTKENGASESEAMKAAEHANRLMMRYNLEIRDISEIENDKYGMRSRPFATGTARRHFPVVRDCTMAIANFCDCESWTHGFNLVYFGSQQDTQFAWFLTDMLQNVMEKEYSRMEYQLKREAKKNGFKKIHGKTLRSSFMAGMVHRINERLYELKRERDQDISNNSTGTSLVVLKNQIIDDLMRKMNINLKTTMKTTKVEPNAYEKGKEAANNVNFSRPVGAGEGNRQIAE